ncbi:SdpI family protein [Hymenobacter sp. DG25B]|uniref:SdpI family protein n=1 Tax=Hymenobacter sp. DG25B TaxID=1385664 RepID=UPI000662BACC|nr:SdpI family protein [Hymenobacter sp. DG25B]
MKSAFSIWSLFTLLLVLLPSLYLFYTWPSLPAHVPTHFDTGGNANGFTNKENMWLLCTLVPLSIYLLLWFAPRLDPKQRLNAGSANYQKLMLALVGLVSGLLVYSLYLAVHPLVKAGEGMAILMGLFFMLIGNYLTTVPPNYFMGFKTPWALEFPLIWARVHRVGGWLFFATGLLSALLAVVWSAPLATGVLIAGVLATVVVVYGYSYYLYQQVSKAA